ncbi:hypothetical protein DPX16_11374 [Anabarilius grahami]|uniref:Ig-like domain-containing protein n=1 Tax=Anabarilius grahami TaxID=495550 RepID=A0A3N0XIJ6_ANAGA|nr:hypothetical protein DPX16_11374 [Anabarilius grahami]
MPTCKILFFLLLALCTSCGECDVPVKYGKVGGEVTMDCEVPQNRDVEWKLNDNLIIKINGRRGTKQKVFAKPGPVLVQSSSAELHCDIGENPNTEVQWQSPSNDQIKDKKVILLKSVTSNDDGQWTCLFKDLKLTLTLTVVGLQTTAVKVPEGENMTLPCSLPRSVSQRVVGGKWTADHLPTAQRSDEGKYVCTVEFEGGVKLTAETNLMVVAKPSGKTNLHFTTLQNQSCMHSIYQCLVA